MKRKEHKIIDCIECKHCCKCNTWKPLDAFYKRKRNLDGLKVQCKDCEEEYQKELRKTDEWKEYQREYKQTEKYKKYKREYQIEYQREYISREDVKEKKNVRTKTSRLLKKLLPQWKRKYILCEICGKVPYEEFHHFVYSADKLLCGLFVCGACHTSYIINLLIKPHRA